MVVKVEKNHMTVVELMNQPKVRKNTIFMTDDIIYYKRAKNDITEIGETPFFLKILTELRLSPELSLLLFCALSKSKEFTTFKGDKEKTLKKIKEKHPELINENDYTSHPFKNFGNFSKLQLKSLKAHRDERIEMYSYKSKEEIRKEHTGCHNYLLTIYDKLDLNKLNLIYHNYRVPNTPSSENVDDYYKELKKFIVGIAHSMSPQYSNDTRHGFKLSVFREIEDMTGKTTLLKNYVKTDFKTGDVELAYGSGSGYTKYSFNAYKDTLPVKDHTEAFYYILRTVVAKSHSKVRNSTILQNIFRTVLSKHNIKHSRISAYVGYPQEDSVITLPAHNSKSAILIKACDIPSELDITDLLKDYMTIHDRIVNSGHLEMFYTLDKFVEIPQGKFKLHDLLKLNKQTFMKLTEYNNFEKKNFMTHKHILETMFHHLNTPSNINNLFEDEFLMVENSTMVRRAFRWDEQMIRTFKISFSEYKKIVTYLDVDAIGRQRISRHAVDDYYRDYMEALAVLVDTGFRTADSINYTPFSLKLEHDIATEERQDIQKDLDDKVLREVYQGRLDSIINKTYKVGNEKVVFIPADTVEKLKQEGKALNHCVGGYATRIINGECLILLCRKKDKVDKSWYTVEIRLTTNGYVLGQQQANSKAESRYKLPNELREELLKDIKKLNRETRDERDVA